MAPEAGSAPRASSSDWSLAARAENAPEQSPDQEGTEGCSSYAGSSPSCRSCALTPRTLPPSSCASPRGPWLTASAVSLLPHVGQLSPQRLGRLHLELFGLRLVRSCHLRTLTAVWLCRASRPSARWPRPSARHRPLFPLNPASPSSAQSVTLVHHHWLYALPSRTSITTVRDPKRS